jgi:hypothetical protein
MKVSPSEAAGRLDQASLQSIDRRTDNMQDDLYKYFAGSITLASKANPGG